MRDDRPADDQVEISIFGPGKGESVVVHLGDGVWIVVDSCVDQRTKSVAALSYFSDIGVDPASAVRLVIATHAHDDHFAGIASVLQASTSATFVCAAATTKEEFLALVEVDRRVSVGLRTRALKEYSDVFDIVDERFEANVVPAPLTYAVPGLDLHGGICNGLPVVVKALSPSPLAATKARRAFAQAHPLAVNSRRHPDVNPNTLSIALWVEAQGKSVLLGADLENGPAGCGWGAVLDWFVPDEKASLIKVPHHGSPDAHHHDVWKQLVEQCPVAALTPFRLGRSPLPGLEDRARILGLTPEAYITAGVKVPSESAEARRERAAMNSLARKPRDPWGRIGHIRIRSDRDNGWNVLCRVPARPLSLV